MFKWEWFWAAEPHQDHTQARWPQHTTPRQAGKTRLAHGRRFTEWPISTLQPTPRTQSGVSVGGHQRTSAIYIFAALILFAQMCISVWLNMGSVFFFLPLHISVLSCPRFPLRPPPPSFLWPPLTVGGSSDNHQAAPVRADTHQRLRLSWTQREICSRTCQETLCC